MKHFLLALLTAATALFSTPTTAQVKQDVLQTPVTTMAPNNRIFVKGAWPKRDYRDTGRNYDYILELVGNFPPSGSDSGSAGSVSPGRWPGTTPSTPGAVRDVGGFRIFAHESHFAFDDPIVYPGLEGYSHAHIFFANTATRGKTTPSSILTTGNSTAAGGTINRSGYWVPAMIDNCDSLAKIAAGCTFANNGNVIRPSRNSGINAYYKGHGGAEHPLIGKPSGYWYFNNFEVALPPGFRMIAGLPTGTPMAPAVGADNIGNGFVCVYDADLETTPTAWIPGTGGTPPCPAGTHGLKQVVRFPACWNGTDLDSPNHKSHVVQMSTTSEVGGYQMLDVEDWFCPSSHPYIMPGVTFKLHYDYPGDTAIKSWRLSSDNYDTRLPAGYSNHGDWFNGWNQDIMEEWVTNCMLRGVDCHDNVIGPGIIDTTKWRVLGTPLGISQ